MPQDPQIVSVRPVAASGQPTIKKVTYIGTKAVSTENPQDLNIKLERTPPSEIPNFNEPAEKRMLESFKYAPYVMGGIYGGAAGAGRGLLTRSLLAGLGGAAGEAGGQIADQATQNPNAPQTSGDAASRIFGAGATQGGMELGIGALMKPIEWLTRGINRPRTPLDEQVARLSKEAGLKLTAPEITGSQTGKVMQRVGSTGLFGQAPARAAQNEGLTAASKLLQDELGQLAAPTTPMQTGDALQSGINQSKKIFSDVYGGRVAQAAGQLNGVSIDISTLKQAAQQELQKAGLLDKFLSGQAGTAQFGNLPPTPANQGLINAIQQQALASGKHQTSILGRPDKTVEGILRDIGQMPDQVPFEVANKLKQDLFDLNPTKATAFADQPVALAKRMNKILTSQMDMAVGGTPAGQAWQQARDAYREGRSLFNPSANQPYRGQFVQQVLNAKPEEVVAKVKSVSDVEALKDSVLKYANSGTPQQAMQAHDTWRTFQRQYVQGLLKDPEAIGESADLFGLKDRMNKVGADTLASMFSGNPQALNNLRAIAEAMSRVQKVGNVNTLGMTKALNSVALAGTHTVGLGLGATVGYMTQSPMAGIAATGAFEALPYSISKVIYNNTATELFIRGLGGMAAESSIPGLTQFGRGSVKAAPYLGTAATNIYRAVQMANAYEMSHQQPQTQSQPKPQGTR